MSEKTTHSSDYNRMLWQHMSGDLGWDSDSGAVEIVKREQERIREEEIKKGKDPDKIDSNLIYLRRKYGPNSR